MSKKFATSKRLICVMLVIIVAAFMLTGLTACNYDAATYDYSLKLVSVTVDEESGDIVAQVSMTSSEEGALDGVKVVWESEFSKDSAFYDRQDIAVRLDGQSIYSAVKAAAAQQDTTLQGDIGDRLKVYLRYDTIYKSIKSNAKVSRSGRYYTHLLLLGEEGETIYSMSRRTPNAANWYGLLIAAAVSALAAVTAIILIKRKENAKVKEQQ